MFTASIKRYQTTRLIDHIDEKNDFRWRAGTSFKGLIRENLNWLTVVQQVEVVDLET
jgi:hypothetical protein